MQPLIPRLSKPLLALLAVALCASGLCVVGADQAGAAGRYVAFGDSSSTGSGLSTETTADSPPLCYQTAKGYPHFVKQVLGFTDFKTVTCASAGITEFTNQQPLYQWPSTTPSAYAPPQFDALTSDTTLVTISIGANDAGYGTYANACLKNTNLSTTPCKDQFASSGVNELVESARWAITNRLGTAIDQIHARSPQAEVWVIGYARLIPDDVATCPGKVEVSIGDGPIFNAWQVAVKDFAKSEAEAHDAYYLDVYTPSAGYDGCLAGPSVRWSNPGPAATTSGWDLHPTEAGELAVANLFVDAFNSPRPVRPVKTGPNGTTLVGQTLDIAFSAKKVRSATSGSAPIMTTPPKKRGAKLEVKLARSGTVEFAVDRAKTGRIKAGKCRSMSRRAGKGRKACTRYVPLQSKVILALPGGSSSVYFTGRAGGKRLAAGKYRLRAALGTLSAKTPTFKLSQ